MKLRKAVVVKLPRTGWQVEGQTNSQVVEQRYDDTYDLAVVVRNYPPWLARQNGMSGGVELFENEISYVEEKYLVHRAEKWDQPTNVEVVLEL